MTTDRVQMISWAVYGIVVAAVGIPHVLSLLLPALHALLLEPPGVGNEKITHFLYMTALYGVLFIGGGYVINNSPLIKALQQLRDPETEATTRRRLARSLAMVHDGTSVNWRFLIPYLWIAGALLVWLIVLFSVGWLGFIVLGFIGVFGFGLFFESARLRVWLRYHVLTHGVPVATFPTTAEFVDATWRRYETSCADTDPMPVPASLAAAFRQFVGKVYEAEAYSSSVKPPDIKTVPLLFGDVEDYAEDFNRSRYILTGFDKTMAFAQLILTYAFAQMTAMLPKIDPIATGTAMFSFDLEGVGSSPEALFHEFLTVFREKLGDHEWPLFAALHTTLTGADRNLSFLRATRSKTDKHLLAMSEPEAFADTPFGIIYRGLKDVQIPWDIPDHLRTQHGVIIGRSGGGKSQLLECLIARDLDQRDPPAVVIIDSKRGPQSLLERIAHLDVFHPDTGRLKDRLIILDHKDKPALNPFDIPEEVIDERITDIASTMQYFLRELLGNELSNQMNLLFQPLLHIVLRVPGATLETFMDVIDDPLHERYRTIVDRLPLMVQRFLRQEYNNPNNSFRQTKASLRARLYEVLITGKLGDLFSAPKNAVDFADAFRRGKTILISTDDSPQGLSALSPVVGRFFVSRILNAGLELGAQERPKRVHLYIDECEPYVDKELSRIFTRLRSNGVGAMVAFQEVRQMGDQVSTIQGNTAIKFMGSVREVDAKAFAADMAIEDPAFIMAQRVQEGRGPTWTKFACYTEDLRRSASITVPIGTLNRRQMPEEAYARLRALNRKNVSAPPPPRTPGGGGAGPEPARMGRSTPAPQKTLRLRPSTPANDDRPEPSPDDDPDKPSRTL